MSVYSMPARAFKGTGRVQVDVHISAHYGDFPVLIVVYEFPGVLAQAEHCQEDLA